MKKSTQVNKLLKLIRPEPINPEIRELQAEASLNPEILEEKYFNQLYNHNKNENKNSKAKELKVK